MTFEGPVPCAFWLSGKTVIRRMLAGLAGSREFQLQRCKPGFHRVLGNARFIEHSGDGLALCWGRYRLPQIFRADLLVIPFCLGVGCCGGGWCNLQSQVIDDIEFLIHFTADNFEWLGHGIHQKLISLRQS